MLGASKAVYSRLLAEKRQATRAIRNRESRGESTAEFQERLAKIDTQILEVTCVKAESRGASFVEIQEMTAKTRAKLNTALRAKDEVEAETLRKELVRLRKQRAQLFGV